MATAPKLTTRVDAVGRRVQQVDPGHNEVFVDSAKTLEDHSLQLSRLVKRMDETTLPARSSPRLKATYFEGQIFTAPGVQIVLRHGYGAPVRWNVARWYATAAGPSVFEVSQDSTGNILTLQSGVAGTAEIEVWPR